MCILSHQVSFSSLPLFLEQELAYTSLILLDMVGASSLQGVVGASSLQGVLCCMCDLPLYLEKNIFPTPC